MGERFRLINEHPAFLRRLRRSDITGYRWTQIPKPDQIQFTPPSFKLLEEHILLTRPTLRYLFVFQDGYHMPYRPIHFI